MLGMFHLLPLLKGWEYKVHRLERWVTRGAEPVELPIREKGWLLQILELTNDCYGTYRIEWQGADLETRVGQGCPQNAYDLGAFTQDPAGWLQRYSRPNPYSTAGIYVLIAFSGGFQGSLMSYVPTVKLSIWLPEESTQSRAYINLVTANVAITNDKLFIQSLRRVLQAKADLWVDPALLVTGPAEFKEASKK